MPKNIVGSKFDDYVKEQIEYRQKELYNLKKSKSSETLIYQNANTAFLRLTSGVDIDGEQPGTSAKKYQLFNTRFDNQFATGVGLGGNTAYGFESNSGYGFSPPPGLVSADVKSLNRGSLREATIKILCHNIDQFNIIDKLYLRLGFSMLLEWGWSQYFNSSPKFKGTFQTTYHNVATDQYFLKRNNQINILNQIQADRQSSCGNYDAMFGLVKNYSWDLQKDGSYDITINLVSVGDVIESLKTNVSHPTNAPQTTNVPQDQPPLQYNAQKSTLNKILWWLASQLKAEDLYNNGKYYLQGPEVTADLIANGIGVKPNQNNDDLTAEGEVVGFVFPQLLGVKEGSSIPGVQAQYFMKLGFLLRCLQNFCLLYDETQSNQGLINLDFDKNSSFCFTYGRHGSLDPRVCLIEVNKDLSGTVPPPPSNSGGNTSVATSNGLVMTVKEYTWRGIHVQDGTNPIPPDFSKGVAPMTSEITAKGSAFGFASANLVNGYYSLQQGNPTFINLYEDIQDKASIEADIQKYTPPSPGYITTETTQPATSTTANVITPVYSTFWYGISTQYKDFVDKVLNKNPTTSTGLIDIGINNEVITEILENNPTIFQRNFKYDGAFGLADGSIHIKEYKYKTVTFTDANVGYTNNNTSPTGEGNNLDVQNNLFDDIKDGIQFKYDNTSLTKQFIGRTLNMYINMDYIAKTLENYIDIKTGAISVYDFLDKLMSGVQHALGNINNFSVSYNQDNNSFRIIDNTFIPGLGSIPEASGLFDNPTRFITHTLDSTEGSFVRDASVKTQLSNNFATSVTVGAQANGNVVGSNSTALSKWNTGLTDRIIHTKSNINNPKGGSSDVATNYYSNVGLIQNLYSAINDGNITDEQIDGSKDAGIDLFNFELGEYVKEDIIPSIGFLPINLELTMDGLSGMRIYESYTADTRLLPEKYQNKIQFITTGISHKIQNNDWTTTITSISGPRYDGKTVKDTPTLKSHNLGWIQQVVKDESKDWFSQTISKAQTLNGKCTSVRGKFIHTGKEPQFSEKRTPRSIILHVTDGPPSQTAQSIVDYVGRCNGSFERGGIHYAVGIDGTVVSGIPEDTVSIHGNYWNKYGIGIEIVNPFSLYTKDNKYYLTSDYKHEVSSNNVEITSFSYGGYNTWYQYPTVQMEGLKTLLTSIMSRYPDIKTAFKAYDRRKIYKALWGFDEIPVVGKNYNKKAFGKYDVYGIYGHATGGGDHGDPTPASNLINMLDRLRITI